MTKPAPFLSVIVPVFNGASVLPVVLSALRASTLPRPTWELIVVDDGSSDTSAAVAAEFADQVVSLPGPPRGPAYARNRGVDAARGEWVAFIDADVRVHTDTLATMREVIEANPGLDAVFGAYDDAPPAPGFLSQYRNLLHRYVHLSSAGEADSFWAGCGAVRRATFLSVGGFDADRYPRPQIEDIDLGYRIKDRGGRILLRPEIQAAHLKRWTFWRSLQVDLFDRGVPWVRLLLARGRLGASAQLNLKRGERLKAVAVVAALVLLPVAFVARSPWLLTASVGALGAVALANRAQLSWFRTERGAPFAAGSLPLMYLYYVLSAASVAIVVVSRALASASGAISSRRREV